MMCGNSAIRCHLKAALLFKCQTGEEQQREHGQEQTDELELSTVHMATCTVCPYTEGLTAFFPVKLN